MNQASTAWDFTASGRGACRQVEYASRLVLREGKKAACQKWWLLQLCPLSREGGHSCRGANVDCKNIDCAEIRWGGVEGAAVLRTLEGLLLK